MGTRSLTIMYQSPNEGGKEIVVLYRQMDGGPEWHGKELTKFLKKFTITCGNTGQKNQANGGECLAAQIIAHFKKGIGMFYLLPAGTRDCGELYRYHVKPSVENGIDLQVEEINIFA